MAFRILTHSVLNLTSAQVPHLRFHNLSPCCISLVPSGAISVIPKKFDNVRSSKQENVARFSLVFEIKCKDLECLYFKRFLRLSML